MKTPHLLQKTDTEYGHGVFNIKTNTVRRPHSVAESNRRFISIPISTPVSSKHSAQIKAKSDRPFVSKSERCRWSKATPINDID